MGKLEKLRGGLLRGLDAGAVFLERLAHRLESDRSDAPTDARPAPPHIRDAPDYVEMPGEQSLASPTRLDGTTTWAFAAEGSLPQLQRVLDRMFFEPTGGQMKFVPLSPFVFFLFNHTRDLTTDLPGNQDWYCGWDHYQEMAAGFVAGLLDEDGEVDSIYLVLPQLFVDNGLAMVSGRESFGYPKAIADLRIPHLSPGSDAAPEADFRVRTLVFRHHGPQGPRTKGREEDLVIVRRMDGGGLELGPLIGLAADVPLAVALMRWMLRRPEHRGVELDLADRVRSLFARARRIVLAGPEVPEPEVANLGFATLLDALRDLGTRSFPVALLKQFRDCHDSSKVCYQAVVADRLQITDVRDARLVEGRFELRILNSASSRLAEELGLTGQEDGDYHVVPVLAATMYETDYRVEEGTELWRAAVPGLPPQYRRARSGRPRPGTDAVSPDGAGRAGSGGSPPGSARRSPGSPAPRTDRT